MSVSQGIQKYRDVAKKSAGNKKTISARSGEKNGERSRAKTVQSKKEPKREAKKDTKKEIKASATKKAAPPSNLKEFVEQDPAEIKVTTTLEEDEKNEIEAALEQDIEREVAKGSTLVKEDFTPVNCNRDRLILEYAPLIKYIAQKIAARLPANIELDDLISSGVIGLMDAIEKYDSSRDNKFKTYAEFRIRGAILDELRAQDWVPRSVREKAKQLERAYLKLEQQLGRQASDEEVCKVLGMTQEEFFGLLNEVRSVSLLSYDDISNFSKADKRTFHGLNDGGKRAANPLNEVTSAYLKRVIADSIRELPEKQRLVLSLYYFEDLNLKEIGKVLDVTESRVSQLHTQAIIRLKNKLRVQGEDLEAVLG